MKKLTRVVLAVLAGGVLSATAGPLWLSSSNTVLAPLNFVGANGLVTTGGLASAIAALPSSTNSVSATAVTNAAITVVSAASNAVAVTAGKIFNVRTYGARGTNSDDSAAIMAAWTAMTNNRSGVLYFPAGRYIDTNTYLLTTTDAQSGYAINYNPQFEVRGDTAGSTYWCGKITNTAFVKASNTALNFQSITLENVGSGYTTGYVGIANTGTMDLRDVRFSFWDTGIDVAGAAGGHAYNVALYGCGTGFRAPAYADGWVGQLIGHLNYRTVLEVGGTVQFYPGVRAASNSKWHIVGNKNRYGAVIGAGGATELSGYLEGCTNAFVAIGHPPEFGDNDADDTIRAVSLNNIGWQQASGSGIQVYARPLCMMVRNSGLLSQNHEVEFMTSTADQTPVMFENCTGGRIKKFGGEIVNVYPHLGQYNWSPLVVAPTFSPEKTDVMTPNTTKNARYGALGYASDTTPQTMLYSFISGASTAELILGGGTSLGRSYSALSFRVGDASAAGAGTKIMGIDSTGVTVTGDITTSSGTITASNFVSTGSAPGTINVKSNTTSVLKFDGVNLQLANSLYATGNITANGNIAAGGVITAAGITSSFFGDATGADINASKLITGTIPVGRYAAGAPSANQVLTYSGSAVGWADPPAGGTNGGATSSAVTNIAKAISGRVATKWFNVADYGAVGDGVTDDTAAIQAAIIAAVTPTNQPTSSVVYFPSPPSFYRIGGGATNDGGWSQIYIPNKVYYFSNMSSLVLKGDYAQADWGGTATTGTTPWVGANLVTVASGNGAMISQATNRTDGAPWYASLITVSVENLGLRAAPQWDGQMLDLFNTAQYSVKGCSITRTNWAGSISTQPATTSIGIKGSRYNMGNWNRLDDVNINGFGIGLEVGEHLYVSYMSIGACPIGVQFDQSNLGNRIDCALFQSCARPIYFAGTGNVDMYGIIETAGAGTDWKTNVAHVSSASAGTGLGIVRLWISDNYASQHNRLVKGGTAQYVNVFNVRDGTWWNNNTTSGNLADRGMKNLYSSAGDEYGFLSLAKQKETYANGVPSAMGNSKGMGGLQFGGYSGAAGVVYPASISGLSGTVTSGDMGAASIELEVGSTAANRTSRLSVSSTGITAKTNVIIGPNAKIIGDGSGLTGIVAQASNAIANTNGTAYGLTVVGTNTADVLRFHAAGSVQTKLYNGADAELVLKAEDGTAATLTLDNLSVGSIVSSGYTGNLAGGTNANASTLLGSGTIPAQFLPVRTTNAAPVNVGLSNTPPIYFTNITGAVTLGLFANMHASEWRQAQLWATNGTATDYAVTLPSGTKTPDGTLTYYVTNGTRRLFSIGGILGFTNCATSTFR